MTFAEPEEKRLCAKIRCQEREIKCCATFDISNFIFHRVSARSIIEHVIKMLIESTFHADQNSLEKLEAFILNNRLECSTN